MFITTPLGRGFLRYNKISITFIFLYLVFTITVQGYPQSSPCLPPEIWYKIASFLPGNDPALRWFLTFLTLTDAQADNWVKKYHRDTLGKNPLTFFGLHSALKQAWLRFNQHRKAIQQALINNDRDTLEHYLETEYATLLATCRQATQQQLIDLKADIEYALMYLEKYYYMAKNQTTGTLPLHTLKSLQQLVAILSFTIVGFTFIITIIEYNTSTEKATKEHSTHNQKHAQCKQYAEQFTAHYNYTPVISITAILLLLNSALFFYIRSISLKHQVTQDIKYLIMSYYNQLKAYKQCIIDLTLSASH